MDSHCKGQANGKHAGSLDTTDNSHVITKSTALSLNPEDPALSENILELESDASFQMIESDSGKFKSDALSRNEEPELEVTHKIRPLPRKNTDNSDGDLQEELKDSITDMNPIE